MKLLSLREIVVVALHNLLLTIFMRLYIIETKVVNLLYHHEYFFY